jgi:hypothetical protein
MNAKWLTGIFRTGPDNALNVLGFANNSKIINNVTKDCYFGLSAKVV